LYCYIAENRSVENIASLMRFGPVPTVSVTLTAFEALRISRAKRGDAVRHATSHLSARRRPSEQAKRAAKRTTKAGAQRRHSRETDLSAQQIGAQAPAWFSRPHGDQRRPQSAVGAARAGTQAAQCVSRGDPSPFVLERLRRRADFRAAARGMRAAAGAFVVQARQRAEAGPIRVGFTVSRQVGNAVERNRVRRRLRDVVRLAGGDGMRPGHDYVVIGRRVSLAAPFDKMRQELDAALRRIHDPQAAASAARAATGGVREPSLHQPSPRPPKRPRNPGKA
jgi:ribonuclease P protein component